MSATIKELCGKLNLTRAAIEIRMNNVPKFRDKYTTKQGNKFIINDKGCQVLSNMNGYKKHVKSKSNNQSNSKNYSKFTSTMLKQMLKQEQSHNAELKEQLNKVNQSNTHLGKLLDQQQQLELSDKAENRQLKGQIKHIKAINGPSDKNSEEKGETVRKPKLSFWQRLFGQH